MSGCGVSCATSLLLRRLTPPYVSVSTLLDSQGLIGEVSLHFPFGDPIVYFFKIPGSGRMNLIQSNSFKCRGCVYAGLTARHWVFNRNTLLPRVGLDIHTYKCTLVE
jgi:hypothetical protein